MQAVFCVERRNRHLPAHLGNIYLIERLSPCLRVDGWLSEAIHYQRVPTALVGTTVRNALAQLLAEGALTPDWPE